MVTAMFFNSVDDSISLNGINSSLDILQAIYKFNKLNTKKFYNIMEVLFHFI